MRVVSISDAALDLLAMGKDAEAYMRTRDESLLKFHPGKSPTWFHLKRISTSIMTQWVDSEGAENVKFLRAFQVGVSRVENLSATTGETVALLEPKSPASGVARFGDEEMDLIWPAYVKEIGAVAYQRSFLAPSSGGGSRPPRWLESLLINRLYQDAAARLNDVSTSSEEHPESRDGKASSGERATAATATECEE